LLFGLAIVAAVAIGLGTLWALRDYANPEFVNGTTAAHEIDAAVGNMIAARFPEVGVGSATCPALLNLTAGRTERCALPVAGKTVHVDVSLRDTVRRDAAWRYRFWTAEALFVRRDAERTIAESLARTYGETFDVHCPGAAVRVLARTSEVTCTVQAPDVTRRSIPVRPLGDDGSMFPDELPHVATRWVRSFGSDVATRREGSVVITGRALEQFVRASAGFQAGGEVGRRGLVGTARCPARVVLHEGTHAGCTVRVGAETQKYDVHFEKGLGLRIDTDENVAVVPALRDFAVRYFERPAFTGGKPANVRVNCTGGVVVFVEPGSAVTCVAKVGAKTIPFYFDILDSEGSFKIVADDSYGTTP
jgi:hypothetical protein